MNTIENIIQWLGGVLTFVALAVVFYGVYRGYQRKVGRTSGHSSGWLRSGWFYLLCSLFYFGLAIWGWQPLPLTFSPAAQIFMLIVGSLLFFPGLLLLLWGRISLGKQYFVSTGFSAQLFEGHQLVTTGAYAYLRHPMYVGLIMMALGSLLLYHTWTTLFFTFFSPFILFRAHREEPLLAQEFGKQWQAYCRRVPAFIPRLKKPGQ